jgi:DNA-binding HxlR family transcriptional regulator
MSVMTTPAAAVVLGYSTENCSIGRTLAIIGEKWTLLVLRDSFLGVRRFDDYRARLGVPRQVLSDRLARLTDEGLLARVPYQEPGQRPRHEYRLTEKGLDLYPSLVALLTWGDKYVADPAGPAVELTHRDCGSRIGVSLRCERDHEVASARQVTPVPGPGARRLTA